jgi:hypothetical protein
LLKYKLIIIAILFISYYIAIELPIFGDEGLYSIAIKDNIELGLQPTATYFGETMYWKPALMFNVYAILASPFYKLIPEEILFRSISFLFVILSSYVLFEFFKKEFNDKKKAYLGLIIILITPCFFVFSMKILTDTLTFLFICIALLSTQNIEKKYNKLFLLISLIGIGLTKSIVLTIFTTILCSVYYFHKNNNNNLKIIGIGFLAIFIIMSYSYIFNLEKLNTTDISRVNFLKYSKSIDMLVMNILKMTSYLGIMLLGLIKPEKSLIYFFTIIFLIYLIINGHYLLPWYLFPIMPIIPLFWIKSQKKEMIIIFLFFNLLFTLMLFASLLPGNIPFNKIIKEELNKTIYIGRLGEPVANKIYDSNGVMVTPENSFRFDLKINDEEWKKGWYGIQDKMTKENLLGLIYDYENPIWLPNYLEDLEIQDKYYPPITRTKKKFDGPFEQIIIEDKYFFKIEEEVMKDYYIYRIINYIDNEDYENYKEKEIYILKRRLE